MSIRNVDLKNHLQEIERHTNSISQMIGGTSQYSTNTPIYSNRGTDYSPFSTSKAHVGNGRFVVTPDGKTINKGHIPYGYSWDGTPPRQNVYPFKTTRTTARRNYDFTHASPQNFSIPNVENTATPHPNIQSHLVAIRQHTQAALRSLAVQPDAPPVVLSKNPPIKEFKSTPSSFNWSGCLVWIIAFLMLLGFCGSEESKTEQAPQQQGQVQDTPVLVRLA